MPLPQENEPWPSPQFAAVFEQMASNNAWYVGDIDAIQSFAVPSGVDAGWSLRGDDPQTHYNNRPPKNRLGARLLRMIGATFSFWGQQSPTGQSRTRIHAPLAGNLASMSGDVLMGEPPTTRLLLGGKSVKGDAQDRTDLILNSPEMHMTLQQGAEYAAAISGSVLTAHWDREASDRPWVAVTACDAAIPEYVLGRLAAVNLWTTYPELTPAGVLLRVYYHVERHEPGRIVHALYKGTDQSVGVRVPLLEHPATEALAAIPGSTAGPESNTVQLLTGIPNLTAYYWRNLPTRQFRRDGVLSRFGRADVEGAEALLDAVDMVWSSWMRDIKLARARLIVPETMLDVRRAGGGANFDDDQEVIQALNFVNLKGEDDHIRSEQFGIRFEEHERTYLALTREVLQHAGYSVSSYGQQGEGNAATATEVNDRRTQTESTRDKKALYYRSDAGEGISRALLQLDAVHYRAKGGLAYDPNWTLDIAFPDVSQIDPEKEARVLAGLRAAQAASTATLVRMQHPDWEDGEVNTEVAIIREEAGLGVEADPAAVDRVEPPADETPEERAAREAREAEEDDAA